MKNIVLILTVIFASISGVSANILNVPSQYPGIQSAINASVNGDTVLVQPGVYQENINFRGKRIVLTSLYYLNHDLNFIQNTIINGGSPVHPDTGSCVIINNNEDSTTVLQGFTLTGGTGTKWMDEHGAGIFREGGGILVQYSRPVIQNNVITGNSAVTGGVISTGGGGVRIGDSYPRFYNNIVTSNSARYGAGVVLNYTGGDYKNNIIFNNFGSMDFGAGSGIWINGFNTRSITIINNTIVNNSAVTGNPGIYGNGGVVAAFRNNIIWGNRSPNNVQIASGNFTVRYCNVEGGYNGAGNINENPDFDTTNYFLRPGSPCADRGDSSAVYNDPPDQNNPANAKWPSRGTIRNDIGAYGGPGSLNIANTVVGMSNINTVSFPEAFNLKQNFPNPFNPKTIISYELQTSGMVTLKVYSILGNTAVTLVSEKQNSGNYSVEFDGSKYPSGVYFYSLETGDAIQVKRMMLLK
ncbi:MAG TPA: T9SS type A sorting domain-containing protein [Ignavibacteria bacterium]|nr:T9SS type A sorting domain-containing protein [Ignavibacteria bacterium]HRJ99904.1 T9SS type A sorting domain-containing protein [Ignavibacteria bacterium]